MDTKEILKQKPFREDKNRTIFRRPAARAGGRVHGGSSEDGRGVWAVYVAFEDQNGGTRKIFGTDEDHEDLEHIF